MGGGKERGGQSDGRGWGRCLMTNLCALISCILMSVVSDPFTAMMSLQNDH